MLFLKSEIVVVTIAVYFAAKVRTIFCTTKETKIKTDGYYLLFGHLTSISDSFGQIVILYLATNS